MHELGADVRGDHIRWERNEVQCVPEQSALTQSDQEILLNVSQDLQQDPAYRDRLQGDQAPKLSSDPQSCTGKLKYLVSYPSNSDRFLEPVGGELRYSDVFTSGWTTLS